MSTLLFQDREYIETIQKSPVENSMPLPKRLTAKVLYAEQLKAIPAQVKIELVQDPAAYQPRCLKVGS